MKREKIMVFALMYPMLILLNVAIIMACVTALNQYNKGEISIGSLGFTFNFVTLAFLGGLKETKRLFEDVLGKKEKRDK